jgi:hypothetical protein
VEVEHSKGRGKRVNAMVTDQRLKRNEENLNVTQNLNVTRTVNAPESSR